MKVRHHDDSACSNRYTPVAIVLHWLMAVAIIALSGVGYYMHDLSFSLWRIHLYNWHKWAGVTIFMFAIIRLGWRLAHRPPRLPLHMNRVEQMVVRAGHGTLYALMFAIPVSGWLMSSAMGFQTVLFGVLPLPDLLAKNKEMGDLLQTAHWSLNLLLAAVVVAHVAAALKHHFVDRDDVLTRMLPRHAHRSRHSVTPESETAEA